ncbi:CinA family protein [Methylomagnum ishizawai]|uniref:CinA family protein n=1 Tax=Methylomagnum ishizawai TaxID=1760988 RepID=UPI001C3236F9|nr:CinA family protein [Methylomagnum ishizawai]BBL74771.1 nicotinamide-nucleotide amidohydrolase PncC [Methylomagnum ishizawai]
MSDEDLYGLARQAGAALGAAGWMLATAESCTGGGVAECVTAVAGSSAWFDRGFVTYSNEAKMDMLGVDPETLREHGAVSEATVREMAEGAVRLSWANIAVAVSGIAGPGGGGPDKPVGLVWFAWACEGRETVARCERFEGDRRAVRAQAVAVALRGVLDACRE